MLKIIILLIAIIGAAVYFGVDFKDASNSMDSVSEMANEMHEKTEEMKENVEDQIEEGKEKLEDVMDNMKD